MGVGMSEVVSAQWLRQRLESGAECAVVDPREEGAHSVSPHLFHANAELDALLARSTQPVMLDFYADWCVSCREMEHFTFSDPTVAARMSQMLLVQADVTKNNADDRALLKRFRLFGPPGIMFFEPGGKLIEDIRVVGFQDARRFAGVLEQVADRSGAPGPAQAGS